MGEGAVTLRHSRRPSSPLLRSPQAPPPMAQPSQKKRLFGSAPQAQPLPRHLPPTPNRGTALPEKQHKQPKIELITSLPLANQNPKGLIKIPPVAKPWVMSDFISEISERDWRMPKQPTCLNTK